MNYKLTKGGKFEHRRTREVVNYEKGNVLVDPNELDLKELQEYGWVEETKAKAAAKKPAAKAEDETDL